MTTLNNNAIIKRLNDWTASDKSRSADIVEDLDILLASADDETKLRDIREAVEDAFNKGDKYDNYREYKRRSLLYVSYKFNGWKGTTLGGALKKYEDEREDKPKTAKAESAVERIGKMVLSIAEAKGWDEATLIAKIATLS